MAGKPKTGLDYAGWSVNLFDGDTKIEIGRASCRERV